MKPCAPEPLPPVGLKWEPLISLISRANRAIAEYNGVLSTLPNPDILLSPMTTREAVLSSQIEGTQATLGDVLKYEAGEEPAQESRRQDVLEIFNYRLALQRAEKELKQRPFSLNLLLATHSLLLDSVRGQNKGRGRFRSSQNWIGAPGSPQEDAHFVPPAPGDVLMQALYEWEKYYHAEAPDPLVQLAIIHAQFEILHPFSDGNGRLGRILIPLFLYEKKVLNGPMFYLSEYLEAHRQSYVEGLRSIGTHEQAWNRWVSFFLDGIRMQADTNIRKAREIQELYSRLKRDVLRLTRSQYAVPLLDAMFQQPVFQSSQLESGGTLPSKPMTLTLLSRLKEAGILKVLREGSGRRAQVLALAELVNVCEGREVL